MKRLTEIGCRYGTDKADYHEYTEHYQEWFEKFKSPAILEIGIWEGASLRMYDEFFQNRAQIVGVDIADKSYIFGSHPRISTVHGDAIEQDTVQRCKEAVGGGMYDIIIDDGGHYMKQQQKALILYWPLLKPGGLFIMEDLHTSLMPQYNPDNTVTTLDVIRGLHPIRHGTLEVTSLYVGRLEATRLRGEIEDISLYQKEWDGAAKGRVSMTAVIQKRGVYRLKK